MNNQKNQEEMEVMKKYDLLDEDEEVFDNDQSNIVPAMDSNQFKKFLEE